MNRLSKSIGIGMTCMVVSIGAQSAALAPDNSQLKGLFNPNKIIGLWDVEVVVSDCDSGETLFSFMALHKFELGGTGQVVPATSPAANSAHMVVWNHVRRNNFQQVMKFYRFNDAGVAIGWNVIRQEITMNQAGNEYVGSGEAEFYALDGSYLFSACPSVIATRFTGQ